MALYYQLVFGILITEIVLFLGLIIPLPTNLRKRTLVWISKNLINPIQYTLKIVFVFVFVLFIDSVTRMNRAMEQNETSDRVSDIRIDTSVNTKKFYAQRNMYLTGSTLFLSLVLNYTYSNIMELLNTEEKVDLLEAKLANPQRSTAPSQEKDIEKMREELIKANQKVVDYETLKKQVAQFQAEYDRVADELSLLQKEKDSDETKKLA